MQITATLAELLRFERGVDALCPLEVLEAPCHIVRNENGGMAEQAGHLPDLETDIQDILVTEFESTQKLCTTYVR